MCQLGFKQGHMGMLGRGCGKVIGLLGLWVSLGIGQVWSLRRYLWRVGLNTFRNTIGAHYLPHSSKYVAPPSVDVVRKWFPMIRYGEEVSTKGTLRKSLLPPRWSIANGIHIDYAIIFWEDIILKDHQATGGPTSLRVTSEERANHQLSSDFTAEGDHRLSAPNDFIPPQQGMDEGTKNTAILCDKEEASIAIHGDKEEASSTIKLKDLVKLVSFPTKLKDLPSKFNKLTEEIKGLKTQVYELKIELPKEPKEIPTNLEDFTKTATTKVESAQAKIKTLDALLSLLLNVTKAMNKFAKVLKSTFTKAGDQSVPSAGQADIMLTEGEKDTN
nr:hypothetical protein [Tanacetum cinerariifolium]